MEILQIFKIDADEGRYVYQIVMAESKNLGRKVNLDGLEGLPFDIDVSVNKVIWKVTLQILKLFYVSIFLLGYLFFTFFYYLPRNVCFLLFLF